MVSELGLEAEPECWPGRLALGEWDLLSLLNPKGPHLPYLGVEGMAYSGSPAVLSP